jgi:hypothetical protein
LIVCAVQQKPKKKLAKSEYALRLPATLASFFIWMVLLTLGNATTEEERGVDILARGEHFNHKKKSHPGKFPKDTLTERQSKDAIGDEEFLVVREAFKNRVETEDVE